MLHGPPELCARCAEETLERIREHRQQDSVSAQVKALLLLIEERLLDSTLRVKALRQWARVHDTNISTRFANELGLGPEEYIIQRRMEIACRLLVATDLKVWQVGTNLGYADGHAFGRAFKNWSGGQTPTEFRKAARASSGEPETLAAPADLVDQEELRRALTGELEADRAAAVIAGLGVLQDQVRANYRAVDPPIPYSEPAQARGLWRFMAHLPAERRALVVDTHAADFETPALFNRLCTEAIEVGADDDVRGLELAVLAIKSLEPILGRLDEPLRLSFFARAYAVAGNAFRRSGELEDAAQSFAVALKAIEQAGAAAHPLVAAELFLYLCCLEIERDEFALAADYLRMGSHLWKTFLARLDEQAQEEEGA